MAKGLTPFGKRVRKLRIDAEVSLKDLGEYLGVSSAYLSGIETGDRPLSRAIVERSVAFFKRFDIDASDLRSISDGMRKSVNVEELDERSRAAIAEFARRLSDMSQRTRDRAIDELLGDLKNRG